MSANRFRRRPPTGSARQAGLGLIEVMVSLIVLAVGLLGVLGMQGKGLQLNQTGYYQSQAMFLAQDIIERARANREASDSYATTFSAGETGSSCQSDTATCNPTQMAASDLAVWKAALGTLLPSGQGAVDVTKQANGLYQIDVKVRYFVGKLNAADAGDDGTFDYQLSAQL